MDNHNTAGADLDKLERIAAGIQERKAFHSAAEVRGWIAEARAALALPRVTEQADALHDNLRDNIGQAIADYAAEHADRRGRVGAGIDWCSSHDIDPLADKIVALIADQQAAPEAPAGYKLVPLEPTPEMKAAADNVYPCGFSETYRAMIAAAPAPAAQQAEAGYCADCNSWGGEHRDGCKRRPERFTPAATTASASGGALTTPGIEYELPFNWSTDKNDVVRICDASGYPVFDLNTHTQLPLDDEEGLAQERKANEVFAEFIVRAVNSRAQAPSRDAAPAEKSADEIVTALYRRFKDWSKRGFGPDDVTWCEVKADVLALIGELGVSHTPNELIEAADAVVERWHSLDWKQPHTAEFIARLSAAVGAAKRNQGASHASNAGEGDEKLLTDSLNMMMWLYRRLPVAYGKPPFVDAAIMKLGERLGCDDVPIAIRERAAIAASAEQEKKNAT